MILLTDEEMIKGVNKGGLAEGGELVSLNEAGRKEYLGVAKAQSKKMVEQIEEIAKARRIKARHRVNYITISHKDWRALLKEIE